MFRKHVSYIFKFLNTIYKSIFFKRLKNDNILCNTAYYLYSDYSDIFFLYNLVYLKFFLQLAWKYVDFNIIYKHDFIAPVLKLWL